MTRSTVIQRCSLWLALSLGMAVPATAQQSAIEQAKDPAKFLEIARKQLKWDEPADPAHIAGPIYFVGTRGLSVFLITSADGHIVLNTGMPGSGPLIEKSIRKLGFKPEDIKVLLAGHAHCDHVGGHAYLQKLSGAKVAMIREEKDLFESGGKLDFHYGKYKEFAFEPARVDVVLKDEDEIKVGDVALMALLTGGHTRGATTFVMKIVDQGKTYSVVFPNGTSVNPGYRLLKDPSYPGIADDFRRTFKILERLEPDMWFYAHNETHDYDAKLARSVKEGTQAWVDPAGYQKWAAKQRAKFDEALAAESKDATPADKK